MGRKVTRFASVGGAMGLLLIALHGAAGATALAAPKIDPGTLGSGVAILTGAALVLVERLRRR